MLTICNHLITFPFISVPLYMYFRFVSVLVFYGTLKAVTLCTDLYDWGYAVEQISFLYSLYIIQ